MPAIYTLGHSTRPLAEFLALLGENGIRLLTDVRRYPARVLPDGNLVYPAGGGEQGRIEF